MSALTAVIRKELKDHFRDRRSVMTALFTPLLGPIVVGAMFTVFASQMSEEKPLSLPIRGAEHAPSLVAFLERHGAETSLAPDDYEAKVKDGDLDVVLVIPDSYGEDFRKARPAKVELYFDRSRNEALRSIERAKALLNAYSGQVGVLRLFARGVSPELAQPVKVQEVDLATRAKMAGRFLNMLPYFLLLAVFVGGMHLAIDATAGERERASLEPLLVNPVQKRDFVLGKWVTVVLVSWISVAVCLAAFLVIMRRVPLEELGVRFIFGPQQLVTILLAVLPLTLFSASLQMVIATYARSFKEAQSYIQVMLVLPAIPGMLTVVSAVKTQTWMMAVPTLGQQMLINEALRGEPVGFTWIALAAGVATVAAGVLLALCVRLFGQEKIVFGRG